MEPMFSVMASLKFKKDINLLTLQPSFQTGRLGYLTKSIFFVAVKPLVDKR